MQRCEVKLLWSAERLVVEELVLVQSRAQLVVIVEKRVVCKEG